MHDCTCDVFFPGRRYLVLCHFFAARKHNFDWFWKLRAPSQFPLTVKLQIWLAIVNAWCIFHTKFLLDWCIVLCLHTQKPQTWSIFRIFGAQCQIWHAEVSQLCAVLCWLMPQLTNDQHACVLVFLPMVDILNIPCDCQFVFSVLDELCVSRCAWCNG